MTAEAPDSQRQLLAQELTRLVDTLHEHHEHLLKRFDHQDDLLNQVLYKPAASPPAPRATHLLAPPTPTGPTKVPALPQPDAQATDAETSSNGGGSVSLAVASRDPGAYKGSELSSSVPPVPLRSYTEEDLALRLGADDAESKSLRKRFSDRAEDQQDGSISKRLEEQTAPWATRIVHNGLFDIFFAFVVVANAVYIGFDVQRVLDGGEEEGARPMRPLGFSIFHYIFSVLFLAELLLRLMDSRCRYFCSEDWAWALLDTLIVLTSWWDIFVDILDAVLQDDRLESISGLSTLKAMRIVRLTRVLKTAHFLRIFRFIMALRMLVQSILHTMKALFWALLLLGLIVYVFGILFAQAAYDYVSDPANPALPPEVQERYERYFESLLKSMLAMFMSITGGVSWEEVITPLMYVSPFWPACFVFFIAFSYLAVLNVVTAVFCQSAIESAQNDHATVIQNMLDNKEQHLQKLRSLFHKIGDSQGAGITYRMFEEKLSSATVREYFETLGLDVWDPWAFFKLLDSDGGGVVELEEFFLGCLRFSGEATAMEVGRVAADQKWLIKSQGRFQKFVEDELTRSREELANVADALYEVSSARL
ncbi:Scn9a [Symbiodinium natans]|uniref:Scn9a protein n=1 Tax=Symbiodinium natans TaxID=878477 RepID=A0A812M671_9DINO|nr:Scn9a [Symbiodinium natans]